ncbi:hypothetical protein BVC93_12240 [Mycobacterium sp. MS1601]|uniref:M28 family metallopeptidase n=1 Tax=Mycobacterium sp. MS1601 TaxID=1936029 RepID=UPI0009791FAE|nr:M28 family metallopeptidase [Mycobacterium sp. MS1601]AQA03075.1 hypothetical protein BVC93_12240 [Mycobacterium sp. MS1601]
MARSAAGPRMRDPGTEALLDLLSPARCQQLLNAITTATTRHSLSAGYAEALEFAGEHLRTAGYNVSITPITVGAGLSHNIVGGQPGTADNPGLVVVCAHLDSVNHVDGAAAPAPGADDNASGSAGALELATVLASRSWRHDLQIILFGGEEQGLLGSRAHVAALSAGDRDRIRAVLNMDMIARRNGVDAGVLIEGAAVSLDLVQRLAQAGATWTELEVFTSLNPFASDHVPFIEAGIPAVLTIEAEDSANTAVHTAADTLDRLDPQLTGQILRMNLAALVGLLD